ncbi:MAG: hypothetical protein ABEK03_03385 [Candidatus Bipolaricaulia bacterium]
MRRASIIAVMILVVAGPIASAQPSGFSVPLAQNPSMYEGRSEVTFAVKACRGRGAFGGFEPGQIQQASHSAASVWNEAFPRVRINVVQGNCRLEPATNNGINELYWTGRPMPAERFGLYVAATQGSRLIEEDILLKADNIKYVAGQLEASPKRILVNALVHEFGHALGLGDAYRKWPEACGWSVMLALCSAEPLRPTSADLQALRSIYGASSDDALNPPSSGSLRRFDANDNGYIDDAELSTAMDQWLVGEVSDDLFFELIDAWTSGRKLESAAIDDGSRFNVTSVTVFNLSGDRVGQSACSSAAAMDRAERLLDGEPQGTYLTVVRDCHTGETRTDKIAQLP